MGLRHRTAAESFGVLGVLGVSAGVMRVMSEK